MKTGAQTETENWIKLLKYEQSRPFPKPSYRHWKSEGWQMGFPFPGGEAAQISTEKENPKTFTEKSKKMFR